MSNLETTLKTLKTGYLNKLKENDLVSFLSYLNESIDYEKAMKILSLVHKISGTGGMYGLKNLSENSCKFEEYLITVKNDDKILDENIIKTEMKKLIEIINLAIKEDTNA